MPIPPEDRVLLTPADVEAADLPDWRMLFASLKASWDTGDFATALALVDGIGAAAEEQDHHPDIDLRYGHVHMRVGSHDVGGVTQRDLRLARTVSDLARDLGATPRPETLRTVELGLDVDDVEAVRPFWAAVLGLEEDSAQELVDPAGSLPTVWFQPSQEMTQRWHADVRIPPEQVERHLKAVLDAGGTLVTDEHAPAFWVVADARGNKACLTTWQGRG